ncbi:MAG: hypothetical protein K6D97_05600 [Clostridia bacterium]|nr:hypothetical protein [Clostridia bacterium]
MGDHFNFKEYNRPVADYIQQLRENSFAYFDEQVKAKQVRAEERDALKDCLRDVAHYLYYLYEQSPKEFGKVFNSIKENAKTICLLPIGKRGIYGRTEFDSKRIHINPNFERSSTLTGNQRRALYLAHEMGHVINHAWMQKVLAYVDDQKKRGLMSDKDRWLMFNGFRLLDEAIAQNEAENFIYARCQKNRPPRIMRGIGGELFNGKGYLTNFDYYGEMQEPAIMFARTLRGIGKIKSDTKALDMLSKRAQSPDFFDRILYEYTRDGHKETLKEELFLMGALNEASYATFGGGEKSYIPKSGENLRKFREIATAMRDYRDPFDGLHEGH